MRPRSLNSRSSASPDDAPVLAPYQRWSRTGSEEYRNGVSNGSAFHRALSLFSLKSRWTRFALRASVVLAFLFTRHLLLSRRNQALVSASAENKDTFSIRHVGAHHHHRARARARRGFFLKTTADRRSESDEATAAAAVATTTTTTTKTTTQASSLPPPSSSLAKMSALGGELVQRSKPASLVIVVPFTFKDAEKVVNGLRKWARPGDPCPAVRMMLSSSSVLSSSSLLSSSARRDSSINANSKSPVDVLFWFNRDLDDIVQSRDAFKENFLKALEPISHCFNRVEFKSARLSEEEDAYPFGPSNQWYDLFLSSERPLANYDYAFWCEHDVMPVQSGWVDALLREATFSSVDFFVKGSLHRGRKLDGIVPYPDGTSWVGHINGNALYKANDPEFLAMISQCREANRGSMTNRKSSFWARRETLGPTLSTSRTTSPVAKGAWSSARTRKTTITSAVYALMGGRAT